MSAALSRNSKFQTFILNARISRHMILHRCTVRVVNYFQSSRRYVWNTKDKTDIHRSACEMIAQSCEMMSFGISGKDDHAIVWEHQDVDANTIFRSSEII